MNSISPDFASPAGTLRRASGRSPRAAAVRHALVLCLVALGLSPAGCTSMLLDKKLDVTNIMGPIGRRARGAVEVSQRDPMAPREGTEEFDKAKELYDKKDYAAARKAFQAVAKKYKDKPIEDEALFMVAESYYGMQHLSAAVDAYDELLKKYPASLFLEKATKREFDIACFWLDNPKPATDVELAHFEGEGTSASLNDIPGARAPFVFPLKPNLFDRQRPLFDTQGQAIHALTQVWLHDVNGPLAADAMMIAATHQLRRGNYQEAERLFGMVREMHGDTKHAAAAYVLGQHASFSSYQGSKYDGKQLEEARRLTESTLRLYPDLPQQKKLKQDLERINAEIVTRDWERVEFYLKRGEKDAAAVYAEYILRDTPESPRAADARALLLELGPEYAKGILPVPLHKPPSTPVENYDTLANEPDAKGRKPGRASLSDKPETEEGPPEYLE